MVILHLCIMFSVLMVLVKQRSFLVILPIVVVVVDPVFLPDTPLEWSSRFWSLSILLYNFVYLGSLLYCPLDLCCMLFQDSLLFPWHSVLIISLYMSLSDHHHIQRDVELFHFAHVYSTGFQIFQSLSQFSPCWT